ncbi:hypothetical protein ACG2F4_07605 [Halalkalibaculum sp. DA3122]
MELQDSDIKQIYVTVGSERKERIIRKIGVADVINPQMQAAKNLAGEITTISTTK